MSSPRQDCQGLLNYTCSNCYLCLFFPSQDPNKPKRAMSAFFLYSQAYRTTTKEENPEASFGDLVSRIRSLQNSCFCHVDCRVFVVVYVCAGCIGDPVLTGRCCCVPVVSRCCSLPRDNEHTSTTVVVNRGCQTHRDNAAIATLHGENRGLRLIARNCEFQSPYNAVQFLRECFCDVTNGKTRYPRYFLCDFSTSPNDSFVSWCDSPSQL